MSKISIFGAGLAGLIAARMLADRHPKVYERQEGLPNNHHALLRFRSSIVGDVTNVPFKKVKVRKAVVSDPCGNAIKDSAIYSLKVTGKLHERSIGDLSDAERYIAPNDLVQRLASTADIEYGVDFKQWFEANDDGDFGLPMPLISTLPVPAMMEIFEWDRRAQFTSIQGWTLKSKIKSELECSINGTIYSARKKDDWYRVSLTGDSLMIEGAGEVPDAQSLDLVLRQGLFHLGLSRDHLEWITIIPAKYQKIAELDSEGREDVKRFIMWLSEEHGIYSLGRFATWRPKLLLDDLVKDVRVISGLIAGESRYNEFLKK